MNTTVLPVLLTPILFFMSGCADLPEADAETDADRKVQELEAAMDAGTFSLGVGTESIVDIMGRGTDSQERRGDERLLIYNMSDGSQVVFVMVPRAGSALELDYVTAK